MNKHLMVGIGGMDCPCCFPAPSSKARRYMVRQAKRKEAKAAMKLED